MVDAPDKLIVLSRWFAKLSKISKSCKLAFWNGQVFDVQIGLFTKIRSILYNNILFYLLQQIQL